ncbi:MAG: ribbon-helix-helix protein, CopG family [Candidatus Moranbacteria bacterium]|nr:ribbon-helix-helix protein, CopG family [Candidatus Moranbacteria bacterium]
MRNIVNISLPKTLNRTVEREVKKGGYASKSEFFRYLLRLWNEKQLAKVLNEDRKEFEAGKGKVLKSLKNLR